MQFSKPFPKVLADKSGGLGVLGRVGKLEIGQREKATMIKKLNMLRTIAYHWQPINKYLLCTIASLSTNIYRSGSNFLSQRYYSNYMVHA